MKVLECMLFLWDTIFTNPSTFRQTGATGSDALGSLPHEPPP